MAYNKTALHPIRCNKYFLTYKPAETSDGLTSRAEHNTGDELHITKAGRIVKTALWS